MASTSTPGEPRKRNLTPTSTSPLSYYLSSLSRAVIRISLPSWLSSSRVAVPSSHPSSSSLTHVIVPGRRPSSSSLSHVAVPRSHPSSSSSSQVVVPGSRPSSSSLSPVVVPPSMRRTAQDIAGTKEKKAHADPGADMVVIRDSDCWSCCDICMDTKHALEMIKISEGCSHSFCASCVTMHVETKILENIANVKCPGLGCGSMIEVGICKGFLKRELLEKWERMRCEAAFTEPQKYYCPFKDCSGMLIMDGEVGDPVRLRECECPYCHRLFCASCRVPWHWKYTCEQFQSMDANDQGKDDMLLNKLARKSKWQRSPKCRFYVQRIRGCDHILCRCGFRFCYRCGGGLLGHLDISCKRHLNP